MILEEKIKQVQDAGTMDHVDYIQLLDMVYDEFNKEDRKQNVDLTPTHLRYFKWISEYLYIKAITKAHILMEKYSMRKEYGKEQFKVLLYDVTEMISISDQYREYQRFETRRILDENIANKSTFLYHKFFRIR